MISLKGELPLHELSGSLSSEVQDAIHKVPQFILEHGNPYATDEVVKVYNFLSGKIVEEKSTKHILASVKDWKEWNRIFHKEHFVEKSLKHRNKWFLFQQGKKN